MAKDVITVKGEDVVVREDTAKAYHGVIWGLITVAVSLGIMAGLFIALFWIGI
jgi:hypothetical protein